MINVLDVEIVISILNKELYNFMDKCFFVRRVVMFFCDFLWIILLVKYLLRKKKRVVDKGYVCKVEDLLLKVYKLIGEN